MTQKKRDESGVRLECLKLAVERYKVVPPGNNTTKNLLEEAGEYVKFVSRSPSDNSEQESDPGDDS